MLTIAYGEAPLPLLSMSHMAWTTSLISLRMVAMLCLHGQEVFSWLCVAAVFCCFGWLIRGCERRGPFDFIATQIMSTVWLTAIVAGKRFGRERGIQVVTQPHGDGTNTGKHGNYGQFSGTREQVCMAVRGNALHNCDACDI